MNKKETTCSECGGKLKSSEVRKNYPFGKKSKPRKTGMCWRCKHPDRAKKMDKNISKVLSKRDVKLGNGEVEE